MTGKEETGIFTLYSDVEAAEIKEMNTFTADGLNKLLHEAEEIMEGWTDTNE